MTEKAKENIQPYVRALIKCVGKSEPGDEGFSHQEHYVFSNIWSDKFNAVDRYSIKKSFDGAIRKFFIHGHISEGEKLQSLLDKYLSSKDWENEQQHEIQRWSLLSLILHLSYNPTGCTTVDAQEVPPIPIEKDNSFDWPAYLVENPPDFISLGSDGSETEDECLSFDDELHGECLSLTEDISSTENVLKSEGHGGGGGGAGPHEATSVDACKDQMWAYIEDTMASAHTWLRGNIHHPSVQGCSRVLSKYATPNLAELCDAMAHVENERPTVFMSEYRVLREVLCALQAPPHPKLISENEGLFLMDKRCMYRANKTVAVPSLSKGSLQSHLFWFGRHVARVREMEMFISEVLVNEDSRGDAVQDPQEPRDHCLPPLTYEAYASALQEFLFSFKSKVLALEEKVKIQDGVCTLLSVAMELQHVFKELSLVHRVHLEAVSCWKDNSNWLRSCRLLTVLYSSLLSAISDMGASICLHLFMKAFQPYLEIIHVWLTEGRLEDLREEFIIFKNMLVCGDTESLWKEGFIVRPYEEELLKTPANVLVCSFQSLSLLDIIKDKVLTLGKNMELLQHLDRLSEVQRYLPSFERSLYDEIVSVLKTEMKDRAPECYVVEDESHSCSSALAVDCDQNILLESLTQSIQGGKDHYLRMAFSGISCLIEKDSNSIRQKRGNRKEKELSCIWKHGCVQGGVDDVHLSSLVLLRVEHWLGKLLESRHGKSGAIVRTLLLQDFLLASHLLAMRRVFFMEEGDCMHHFCTYLFQQAEKGEWWVDTLSLGSRLHEFISMRHPDVASNFSVLSAVVDMSTTSSEQPPPTASSGSTCPSVLEQVDNIQLNYAVQWPANIVLNAASMERYNTIFQFLLKVKWALWSLQQLRFYDLNTRRDKPKEEDGSPFAPDAMPMSAKVHGLQLLRAWLLHFVGSVHAYLMGQVLHVLGTKVEEELELTEDLDSIIRVHENYLELVYQQCLQTKNSEIIKMTILKVLDISMALCRLWKHPTFITQLQLYDMESQYIRHHVFLARVLENAMKRGSVDHLKALVSALVHSFPSH